MENEVGEAAEENEVVEVNKILIQIWIRMMLLTASPCIYIRIMLLLIMLLLPITIVIIIEI